MHTKEEIARKIVSALSTFSFTGGRRTDTQNIKELMASLGRKLQYHVWASGLQNPNANNTEIHTSIHEWLYDLIWYRYNQNEHYALTELYLAMESEWDGRRNGANDQGDHYGEVKFDFQKLLVCNSPIKLMIFQKHGNDDKLKRLLTYFQARIDESVYSRSDECFIIAYFQKDANGRYSCETRCMHKTE